MTGAINYVCQEVHYVSQDIPSTRFYFSMVAPMGLSVITSNMEKTEFYHLLFTLSVDIACSC